MTTLVETTTRLAELTRRDLQGAELVEFKPTGDDGDEQFYVVRWTRDTEAAGRFKEYGTHKACLHADGRSMLVSGHYYTSVRAAERDYKERRF